MRFTIKLKLGLTFATIIVLSTVTAVLGITSLASLDNNLETLVDGPVQRLQWAEELFADVLQVVRAEKNMILATAPEQVDRYDKDITQIRQELLARLDKALAAASVEGRPKWEGFRASWLQFTAVDDKLRDLAKHGGPAKAQDISVGQGRQLVAEAQKQIVDLVDLSRKQMHQARLDASHQYESARTLLLAAIAASLLIAIGAGVWISLTISRGLGLAGALAQAVAGGDL